MPFLCDLDCPGCPWPRNVEVVLPPAPPGEGVPLIGCGVAPPPDGEWARCTPWPLADGALDGGPGRLAVVLGGTDPAEATARLEAMVAAGVVAGVDLVVPAQTLRALAEHNPLWTGRRGPQRVLGVSRSAWAWGGHWDLARLAVYDGSSGRAVNAFDGAGFAVLEVRAVREEAAATGPDELASGASDPRSPLPFMDVVRWEGGRTQVILRPTPACNQRCPHCLVPPFVEPAPDEIDAALALAEETLEDCGEATLVLSGGEPLLSPELDRVIRWARSRPAVRISLQTNATSILRQGAVIGALRDAGLWDVLVNLPSFDEGTYRAMTGGTDLLADALRGVDRLVEAGLEVNLNLVLTRLNASQVRAYVSEVASRWRGDARVTLSTLSPATPPAVLSEQGVSHTEAKGLLQAAVDAAREHGVEVVVAAGDCAPPACLIPAELVRDDARFQRAVEEILLVDGGPPADGARYKVAGCSSCRFDGRCPGVAAAHVAAFGVAGLSPVSADDPVSASGSRAVAGTDARPAPSRSRR